MLIDLAASGGIC